VTKYKNVVGDLNERYFLFLGQTYVMQVLNKKTFYSHKEVSIELMGPVFPPESEENSTAKPSGIRTFTMYRQGDLSETHDANQAPLGPDVPAFWGVEFPDGTCVLRWNGLAVSTSCWDSVETALKVHGHLDDPRYAAMLVWDE